MKQLTLDTLAGNHISSACEEAVLLADKEQAEVTFDFNGTKVVARPGDSPVALEGKWKSDMDSAHQQLINSAEYKERERKRVEEQIAREAATMRESASTEKELREASVPWPQNERQLLEYIHSLVEREHDYETCVYAMSMAAVAAFYYVSHKLGVTGFQASCADLDILRRTRSLDGPFMLLKAEDLLYPQYDLREGSRNRPKRNSPVPSTRTPTLSRTGRNWRMLNSPSRFNPKERLPF